jgi:hypothetical protein
MKVYRSLLAMVTLWDFPRLVAVGATTTLVVAHASAAVLYVDLNSSNPQAPYADWTTAATNIQDAVDAANAGDLVLVTNGLYQTGGRVIYGALTNRVAVNKALTLRSVNGPNVTTICGNNQVTFPSVNVRCVYLTNGAVLSGFTLTNGGTLIYSSPQEDDGAGVWCESTTALISNCVITASSAFGNGGGAYLGTLANCTLTGNSARAAGGGAQNCTVSGCVLSNNFAALGAGASGGQLTDCTIIGNGTTNTWYPQGLGGGVYQATLNNCSVIGNTAGVGGGAANSILIACTLRANSAASFGGGASGGVLTNCTLAGNIVADSWPNGLGGGAYQATLNSCVLSNNSAYEGGGSADSSLTNCILTANSASFSGGGAYDGIFQDCTISTNLAQRGGGVGGGTLINCTLSGNWAHVAGDSPLAEGGGAYGCPPGAWCNFPKCTLISCVLIGNQSTSHEDTGSGGGVSGCFLTNCLLSGNFASEGGGARGSALVGCTLVNNTRGWGAGAESSTLNSCLVVSNRGSYGGGLWRCGAANCVLIGNSAYIGGGATEATLNNCTVVLNSASYGGGVAGGAANNCIVYSNTADDDDDGPNYVNDGWPQGLLTLNYCCTFPLPTNGICNITNDPAFVNLLAGDFHLQTNSPCINSGLNSYAPGTIDLDGNPRMAGGTVDIGAYEFQSPSSLISYAWLQQFNLPTDGSADFSDPDADHMNNWQEWRAGTDPTNPSSLLRLLSPATATNPSGLILSWQSVPNCTYFLQRSTNLTLPSSFITIQSNISGLPNITSCSDSNTVNGSGSFYRVGVQ